MPDSADDARTPQHDRVEGLELRLANLWQRSRASARERAHAIHPRLDPTAYPLVAVLGRRGPTRPSELGDLLYLDRSTVTRQVDAAARLGLVTRLPDPTDARARLVALTEEAGRRLRELQVERTRRWRAALATWPEADVERLTALLGHLVDADVC